MEKAMIKFDFRYSDDTAVAISRETRERKEMDKKTIIAALEKLNTEYSSISCQLNNNKNDEIFIFRFKKENEDFTARIIVDKNDSYINQLKTISELYTVKKKYRALKIITISAGIILVAATTNLPQHASNFFKYAIEKDNEDMNKKIDLNRLDYLASRIYDNNYTMQEYNEFCSLYDKYADELEEEVVENYGRLIEENTKGPRR